MIFYVKPKLYYFDRKRFLKDFHIFSYLIVCSYNFKLLDINLNSKFTLEKAYFQFPLAWVHSIYVVVATYIAFIVKSFLEFASSQLFWLGYFVLSLVTYNFLSAKSTEKENSKTFAVHRVKIQELICNSNSTFHVKYFRTHRSII